MTLEACAALVHRGDPDRFLATMAAPVSARRVLFPLYAFNLEISRAAWVTAEPMIAEMRLQFWRDVVDELSGEKPPRAHEVARPLGDAIPADIIGILDGAIRARRWDIYKDAFEDSAAFDDYIDQTSGTLSWVAAAALGAPSDAEDVVRNAAWAHGLAAFMRAIPALEDAGRVPLVEGTPQAVRDLANEGLSRLAKARRARQKLPRQAAPALFSGWRAEAALKAAAAIPERVIEGNLAESEFARRTRLLWVSSTGRW